MTYPETIKYLESFINYEKIPAWPYKESLKLERIKAFLATLDNPQDSLKAIHIAGTKGKGSTCAYVSYILREAGYEVGLYTSPHLSDFRERIRILKSKIKRLEDFEGMISQEELVGLVQRLRPAIDKYNRISQYGPLSFFEVYTTLAFVYFKEKKADFVVLETGLGGRLDATNVVNPLVCAITPISYEHTQKLGNTLREIATEKAGIIKNQISKIKYQRLIVISAPQEKEAMKVIKNRCKEVGAKLSLVGKDIVYARLKDSFKVKGRFGEYSNLEINLVGEHQIVNATVAVGVIEALRDYGIKVSMDAIRKGLAHALWPGRCEAIAKYPLIVLDGAQNIASCACLKKAIKENFKYNKLILVLGISQDKDMRGICHELGDLADEVILTKANNLRATSPEALARYFRSKQTHITNNVKEAKMLTNHLAKKNDLVLITGSLFVVGEAREIFRVENRD